MSSIEKNLQAIFSNTNEWLKFAEAKNGALLAVNAGSIFGILQLNKTEEPTATGILILCICLVLSLLVNLISFIPKTKSPQFSFAKKK